MAKINLETGEEINDSVLCITTNKRGTEINVETGEIEQRTFKSSSFRVPSALYMKNETSKIESPPTELKCILRYEYKVILTLLLLSLKFILPSLAVVIWLCLEQIRHVNIHKQINLGKNVKMPFPQRILFSLTCSLCQSEKTMKTIGKLQDERTLQIFRRKDINKYVNNLAIAT